MADWFTLGAAGISALASLGGGAMSASGAAAANAQAQRNQQIMFDQSQAFNLGQAEEARRLQNEQFYNNLSFQSQQAQNQMSFQSEMSNTAYQRAMSDMRQAGLNPMLAYQQGGAIAGAGAAGSGGGGSPTAASVSGTGAPVENTQAELGRAIGRIGNTAIQAYKDTHAAKLTAQQEKTESERTNTEQNNTRLRSQETSNAATMGHNLQQDWHIKERQKKLIEEQTNAARANSAAAYAAAGKNIEETNQYKKHGMPGYGLGERIIRGIDGAGGPVPLPEPSWPFNK